MSKYSTKTTIASVLRILLGLFTINSAVMKILDDTDTRSQIVDFSSKSTLFSWFYAIFAQSEAMTSLGLTLVIVVEILLGLWLLSGFLVKLSGMVNFVWILFLLLSWIPQWGIFAIILMFPILYAIPAFMKSDRWAFMEKYVPEKFIKYH